MPQDAYPSEIDDLADSSGHLGVARPGGAAATAAGTGSIFIIDRVRTSPGAPPPKRPRPVARLPSPSWLPIALGIGAGLTAALLPLLQFPAHLPVLLFSVALGGWALRVARVREAATGVRVDPLIEKGAHDGLFSWQLGDGRAWFSQRWFELFGTGPVESPTIDLWTRRIHPQDRQRVQGEIDSLVAGRSDRLDTLHRVAHGRGGWRWVEVTAAAERDASGRGTRIAGSIADVTQRRDSEARLVHQAYHDALTGLPNRQNLLDRLSHALARSRRVRAYEFAVLFLDVDGFKLVNDSLGHASGDELLVEVAARLGRLVRPGDVVARLGGDEFAVLLDGVEGMAVAERVAERVVEAFTSPLTFSGKEITLGASIGIAHGDPNYADPADILRDADTAMYKAKGEGKGRFRIFDRAMHEQVVARVEMESALRQALARHELVLHYQPLIDLRTGRIKAFEALLRWQNAERGMVGPDAFIPLAEETGLIEPIGEWVVATAARQLRVWRDRFPAYDLTMNVNLSGRQFRKPHLADALDGLVRAEAIDPAFVRLEITETVMMGTGTGSQDVLEALKSMGFRLAIDDFGTGYSSLAYLHKFPVDSLKIDKSFVKNLREPQVARIARTIVDLSRSLDAAVTAEGIEDEEQLAVLRGLGVDSGQGYFFSRPVPAEKATVLLQTDPRW